MGAFSAMSSIVRFNRLPFLTRGANHLQRSCTAPIAPLGAFQIGQHTFQGEEPLFPAFLTIQTSQTHMNSVRGRKSLCPNTPRQGGVAHQLLFFSWAAGSLKATSCWLASSLTWTSLKHSSLEHRMDWNSTHQLGYPSTLLNVGPDPIAGEAWVGLYPCWDFFVFWEGWQKGFGIGDGGAGILRALIFLVGSMGLEVSRCFGRDAAASGASSGSCSSPRRITSSSGVVRSHIPCLQVPRARPPQYHPHWDSLKGPCISGVPTHHRGLWSAPLTFLHRTAALWLRPGFSPVSQSRNP